MSCPGDTQAIQSMSPNFGGIQGFYSIAKGISDGLQSTPDAKTYNDLNNLLFGNSPVSADQVAQDMIVNQIGAIIFWSIGFVFVLAAIVLFLVTVIVQCCCGCRPKEPELLKRRKISGFLLIGFLISCFAFLLTGVILYNLAQTDLTNGIDQGDVYTEQISGDLTRVLTDGNAQIQCDMQNTTQTMFAQLELQMQSYAKTVIDQTKEDIGFTALQNFDEVGYNQQIGETNAAGQKLQADFEGIQGAQCATMLQNYTRKINEINTNLKAFSAIAKDIKPKLVDANEQFENVQTQIQQQADLSAQQMNQTQAEIQSSLDSINTMINEFLEDLNNIINSVKRARLDIVGSSTYTAVQISARLIINIPSGIILIYTALAALFITLRFSTKNPSSWLANLIIIIGFYLTVLLSIILILISSAAFVGGWLTSAMCVPIFEDPNYRLYHLINFTSPNFNGQSTNINAGDALTTCQSTSATVFGAINGQNFLSLDSINQQLNLNSYRDATNQQIRDQTPPNFSYPTDLLHQKLLQIQSDRDVLEGYNNDLSTVCAFNMPADVSSYLTSLNSSISNSAQYLRLIDNLNNNVGNSTNITISINNRQFDEAQATVNTSVNQMIYNLQNVDFKCRPIVDIYNNGGDVICQQFGEPVQGLWAAIGLVGLMAFFAAVLLILTYRWLTRPDLIKGERRFSDGSVYRIRPEVTGTSENPKSLRRINVVNSNYLEPEVVAEAPIAQPRGLQRNNMSNLWDADDNSNYSGTIEIRFFKGKIDLKLIYELNFVDYRLNFAQKLAGDDSKSNFGAKIRMKAGEKLFFANNKVFAQKNHEKVSN
ncbi:unnamed protein product [Caenorhabditis angaria]|uniref:Uncharacterized protein n=1 Tax=Caenorhabditis angaria TaxID=860376 RepID=A0A9P1IDV1_9PELO|nr:unnamed protein product [Caenorhabditis angaria]